MTQMTRIYVLRDPRTNEVRYVGKTVKKLHFRLAGHIYSSKTAKTYRDNWIASLLAAGLRPIIEQIDSAGDDWAEREQYWIAHYRSAGARLANHTDGGEGVCGLVHTEEFRLAQAQRVKAAMTPERRAAHSIAMKRVAANPDWVKAQVEKLKERALDPAWRASQSQKTKATMTAERLAQMSEIGRAQMTGERLASHIEKLKITTSDPAWRARQSAAIKAIMTPERRAEISAKTKASMTPERRKQIAEKQRLVAANPEYKANQIRKQREAAAARAADPVAMAAHRARLEAAWTPERRAAQAERSRARRAAKTTAPSEGNP
jgi:hypothetical protein